MYRRGRGHLVDSKQSRVLFLVQTANTILLPNLIPCLSISAEDRREHDLRKQIWFGVKNLVNRIFKNTYMKKYLLLRLLLIF